MTVVFGTRNIQGGDFLRCDVWTMATCETRVHMDAPVYEMKMVERLETDAGNEKR